jgi:hypothetical protein
MVSSNIHHHSSLPFQKDVFLHRLSLADPAVILDTFIHSFIKMLSKSFVASVFLLALTSSVNANCVITPALGVSGDPAAGNVQHPSSAAPCGDIPIGSNLDSSSTIQADTNGQFTPSITNFAT